MTEVDNNKGNLSSRNEKNPVSREQLDVVSCVDAVVQFSPSHGVAAVWVSGVSTSGSGTRSHCPFCLWL